MQRENALVLYFKTHCKDHFEYNTQDLLFLWVAPKLTLGFANLALSSGFTHCPSTCLLATALADHQGSEVTRKWGGVWDAPCPPLSSRVWTALWTEPSEQRNTWSTHRDTWLVLWLLGCSTTSCWLSPTADLSSQAEQLPLSSFTSAAEGGCGHHQQRRALNEGPTWIKI